MNTKMIKNNQKKYLGSILAIGILLAISFVLASHVIDTSTGTSYSVNQSIESAYNITVNNSGIGGNITEVNITIPSSFTFNATSNATSVTVHTFTNTTSPNVLNWSNSTVLVENNSILAWFSFNATASTPGNYNFTIVTSNSTSIVNTTNISVTVNDTTAPYWIDFVDPTPANNTNLSQSYIEANISVNDSFSNISTIRIYLYNTTGLVNNTNVSAVGGLNATGFVNFSSVTLPDGIYYLNATANDTAGNENLTGPTRTITLDTTGPVITLFNYTNATLKSNYSTLALNVSVVDTISNVSACVINVNDKTNQTVAYNSTGWCNATAISLTGLADGNYTINVYANDTLGNFALNDSYVVQINTAAFFQSAVDLGNASNFTILSKSAISTTGETTITGDIGISPPAATYITGFDLVMDAGGAFATSTYVNGSVYASDYDVPTPAYMTDSIGDMETAYTDAAGRTNPVATELGAGDISGMTLYPGVYKWSSGLTIQTDVTLDCLGNSSAVFIFQIAQTLTVANGKVITLSGNCQVNNIFWAVEGTTTLGTTSQFKGNILSVTDIIMQTGATLSGRALAQTAVALDANTVSSTGAEIVSVAPGITLPLYVNGTAYTNLQNLTLNISLSNEGTGRSACVVNLNGVTNQTANQTIAYVNGSNGTGWCNTTAIALTGLVDDNYTINVYANDTLGTFGLNDSYVVQVDSTYPLIDYGTGVEDNNTNISQSNIYVNVSVTEANEKNITFLLHNSTGFVNSTTYTTAVRTINWTGLPNGVYTYNVTVVDYAENSNTTLTRTITLDPTAPLVDYGLGVEVDDANVSQSNIYVNISVTETNEKNITFLLHNSTGLVNSTTYTTAVRTINWTGLPNGVYTYNVTVIDDSENSAITTTRTITLDSTAPTVTFSCDSSVDLWATLVCSCTGVDAGGSGVESTTITRPSSTLGDNTATCAVTDYAGNSISSDVSYTVSAASSSSGGGGYPTYSSSQNELTTGSQKTMRENWKISFKVGGESHTFEVDEIGLTTVKITITSDPQEATLSIGEEKKFDVTGDGYYDVSVKLDSIDNSNTQYPKADFTITTIHEEIAQEIVPAAQPKTAPVPAPTVPETTSPPEQTRGMTGRVIDDFSQSPFPWIILVVLLIALVVFFIIRKRNKDLKKKVKISNPLKKRR
ncbi:MAG: ice-binding family protein [Nanoarchaeota archaeon]|jgi:hypothetical protein|nr:ice-binding family protein [Nanoarchaeota archaeon]